MRIGEWQQQLLSSSNTQQEKTMSNTRIEHLVWPDGFVCLPEELEEALLCGRSDDFELIEALDEEDAIRRSKCFSHPAFS